ncbi:hypothetical protein SLEP1_g38385 [Rubroshorea leprosula]|nr:hypothetical protein SLEP1_g38385 [Rubroshorea leprosula]
MLAPERLGFWWYMGQDDCNPPSLLQDDCLESKIYLLKSIQALITEAAFFMLLCALRFDHKNLTRTYITSVCHQGQEESSFYRLGSSFSVSLSPLPRPLPEIEKADDDWSRKGGFGQQPNPKLKTLKREFRILQKGRKFPAGFFGCVPDKKRRRNIVTVKEGILFMVSFRERKRSAFSFSLLNFLFVGVRGCQFERQDGQFSVSFSIS